eukprot:TRINITY_DN32153_c0_g1_i1.p1 TRINITY_DN32153_c0_g1~~TRINITY_DN32153_c0_g1_i1.p1  ORF type:complete len:600 (+),score=69.41 TRINITY_DN32153_c0_g1_i1:59-1801(+)
MACADGLLAFLGFAGPRRASPNQHEEFPIVCKWASLLDSHGMIAPACRPAPKASVHSAAQGDLVILSKPLKPEVHLCPAVVTEVKSARCTVAVLDPSRSFRIAECQAHVADLQPIHSEWRLGERLVIAGSSSSKMKHLNGLSAMVCEHKRHGHPCFIQKPGDPKAEFRLKICVQWHDPQVDESGAVLLEPRQLVPCGAQAPVDRLASTTSWTKAEQSQLEPQPLQQYKHCSDTTLLTASRRQISLAHKDLLNVPNSQESLCEKAIPAHGSGGISGLLSWMLEGHTKLCEAEEEWPTVCKMTSVIAVDAKSPRSDRPTLLAIPEHQENQEESMHIRQCQQPASACSAPTMAEKPAQGDLVILGRCVQPEFQLCWAVVTTVEEKSCKVAVLDATKSFCIGECCPLFSQMLPVNSDWRAGSRLVIGGLQTSHMKHLNGLTGIVHAHKRHGHPCFLTRPGESDDGNLWLNICIRLEDPQKASMHAVLLEPSFLSPCAQVSTARTLAMPERPLRKFSSNKQSGYEKNLSLASTASGIGDYSRTSSLPSLGSFSCSASSSVSEMSPGRRLHEIEELRERLKAMAQQ